jgi:hypothetical protein
MGYHECAKPGVVTSHKIADTASIFFFILASIVRQQSQTETHAKQVPTLEVALPNPEVTPDLPAPSGKHERWQEYVHQTRHEHDTMIARYIAPMPGTKFVPRWPGSCQDGRPAHN